MNDHSPRFLRICEAARAAIVEISASQAAADTARLLIDVREDREWNAGHPAVAVHLGRGVLERDIERLVPDPTTPIALLCGGGFRSALAAESLTRMGYTDVASVAGGVRAWQAAGLPWTPGS